MNTPNRIIFVIICFLMLITACSNGPTILSATADKVVIKAQPESFVAAYEVAQKECKKDTENIKNAKYIADETTGLKEVAFNCVDEQEEVAAATEEAPTETDEATIEAEVDAATETQEELETEEPTAQ